MERRHIRNVNQETPNAPPLPMLPPSGRGRGRGNASQAPQGQGQRVDSNVAMDPQKLKRIAASREYSQKYRLKQMQHIANLEEGVRKLETEVATMIPKIKYTRAHNELIRLENGCMKEKLSSLAGTLSMKQAVNQELDKEIEVLKLRLSMILQQSSQFGGQSSIQTMPYNNQVMNMGMNQPAGFNQFAGTAALPPNPMVQNQHLGNQFGYDVNNGDDDRNLM